MTTSTHIQCIYGVSRPIARAGCGESLIIRFNEYEAGGEYAHDVVGRVVQELLTQALESATRFQHKV